MVAAETMERGVGQQDSTSERQALLYHGGNLAVARAVWPRAPEPWLDLSTGINPVPYPVPALPIEAWTRLPEATDLAGLEQAGARAYGVEAADQIVAAPGTQALLQLLPRLLGASASRPRVGILGFTYAEHERTWRAAGAEVETVEDPQALAGFDVGVVVNPNNPDGRLVPAHDLAALAAGMAARGGCLVVDEAFADVLPRESSLAGCAAACGGVVLRSFGKTYGLAGVRLGFLIGPRGITGAARAAMGPWAVSGPAIAVGRAALGDQDWLARTTVRLRHDARRLDALLERSGFEIAGGTPLFRLAQAADAGERFSRLAERGVLVRAFARRPRWLRFGLPGRDEEWDLLAQRLGA